MLVALLLMRQPLPTRLRDWLVLVAIGLSGNVLPFMLVAWGQREVDSGVTAVLMSMVPLFIVVIAHYFTRDERLTRMKALAVLVAFAGACVIALPSALGQFAAPLTAYLAIGLATLCYAITGQLVYTVRHLPPLTQSSAALLMAALVMTPLVTLRVQSFGGQQRHRLGRARLPWPDKYRAGGLAVGRCGRSLRPFEYCRLQLFGAGSGTCTRVFPARRQAGKHPGG